MNEVKHKMLSTPLRVVKDREVLGLTTTMVSSTISMEGVEPFLFYIPRLDLAEPIVRSLVQRKVIPLDLFRGATLELPGIWEFPVSMVLGYFSLYEDGDPAMKEFVLCGGVHLLPDPATVNAALKWLPRAREELRDEDGG